MRVDLPAPFSPQIAWISPRRTWRLTSESALTPGKVLVLPRISSRSPVPVSLAIVPPAAKPSCRSANLVRCEVSGLDEGLLVVRLVHADRFQQHRRHHLG